MEVNYIKKVLKEIVPFQEEEIELLSKIIKAYLKVKKLRISEIARAIDGSYEGNYKSIENLLDRHEVSSFKDILKRLIPDKVEFLIIDPTEIERREA